MKPKFTEEERKLIGRPIRDSRYAEKYTLEQLAEIIGCSPKHLGDVERGTVSASWPLAVKIGKAKEKQSDDTTGKYRTITEEEYQRYVCEDELFKIIVETEAALHNIEDPVEIAVGVMKAACKFYEADWCGILIADLRSELWRPEAGRQEAGHSPSEQYRQPAQFHPDHRTDHIQDRKEYRSADARKHRQDWS